MYTRHKLLEGILSFSKHYKDTVINSDFSPVKPEYRGEHPVSKSDNGFMLLS
jgi:hypothetical protein